LGDNIPSKGDEEFLGNARGLRPGVALTRTL